MGADLGKLQIEVTSTSKAAINEIEKLITTLENLKTVAQSGAGLSDVIKQLNKLASSNKKIISNNQAADKSFKFLNIGAAALGFRKIINEAAQFVNKSNDYVENLNLFTVAMGEYADEARNYAEQVGNVMGIDPSEWMRSQGVFKTLADGFGVASDRATLMSKNLTQLGYDISSFYNIGVEEAMQKLQSGIAGELEPLRRLGYDLSQAKLEAVALSLGIDKSVSSMNQAEKAQLRYVAIMTQVTKAQGDMARTINSPANQLRIFSANIDQAGRAIGNILIPMINASLPPAIAFLQIIRDIANAVANVFGFEIPEFDYSGIDSSANSMGEFEEATNKAGGAAKKLKSYMMGFDELNVIDPNQSGGGGGGASNNGASDWGFKLPEYDFLGDLEKTTNELYSTLKPLVEMILEAAAGFALWKISKNVITGIESLVKYLKKGNKELTGWEKAEKIMRGVIVAMVGIQWSYDAGKEIGKGTAAITDIIKGVLGPIASGLGGAMIGSVIPGLGTGVGFAIGLAIGAVFEIIGIFEGQKQKIIDAFYASDFGQGVAEINAKVEEMMTSNADLKVHIDSITGQVSDATFADFTLANNLIDEIFSYDTSKNLTATELDILKTKIATFNSLGLGEIRAEFTETSAAISTTKSEIQGVINNLLKQYQLEATKDALIESYKAQHTAMSDVAKANEHLISQQAAYNTIAAETKLAEEELAKTKQALAEADIYWWQQSAEEQAAYQQLSAAVVDLNTNQEELATNLKNAKTALDGTLGTYGAASDKVKEMEDLFGSMAATLNDATPAMTESGEALAEGAAKGVTDGIPIIEEALENAAIAGQTLFDYENGINSPAKDYIEKGKYIMLGAAEGITEGTESLEKAMADSLKDLKKVVDEYSLTDSFRNLMNGVLSVAENAFNRIRNAYNDMLSNLKSSASSVSISSSGTVTYNKMKSVSIPKFASGGFPEDGLFFANSTELVGRFANGKTAVANNDQIIQGVAQGVYDAMIAAMGANGDQQSIAMNVYLDGKQLAASVEKQQREQGAPIISGGWSYGF